MNPLDDARRDLVHATRLLRRSPAFAITAILSLGIGIGANTAVFTVANALLFRDPVGVAAPDRLVDIGMGRPGGGLNPTSYPNYVDVRDRMAALDGVYAQQMFPHAMGLRTRGPSDAAERVYGHYVSINYFTVLGASASAGRLFSASDSDRPGASPLVVLSHGFWTRRFNADPGVIGETVQLNGEPFTVVGVAARGFTGTGMVAADVWVPLTMMRGAVQAQSVLTSRSGGWLMIGARLKPGASIEQADDELSALAQAIDPVASASAHDHGESQRRLHLVPWSRSPGNSFVLTFFSAVLMTIVGLVLAVACANVSGLLLARATTRRREIAVRLAIGAGRARMIRQLLTETLVLFAAGGAAGIYLADVGMSLIVPLLPSLPFPITVPLTVDTRVLAFTTGLSLCAALIFGLAPALQASRASVITALKDDAPMPAGRSFLRGAFVVAQIAGSIVLVVTAGLFVRALQYAGSTNPGFDARGVEIVSLDLSIAGYTDATGPRFWREALERVRQLPGVQAATVAKLLPGGFEGIGLGGISVPGGSVADEGFPTIAWNIVEPGYFATLRIPIVAGRDFMDNDVPGAPLVVVIGQGAARRYWPGQNAVGKFLTYKSGSQEQTLTVIGVVEDVRSSSLIDGLNGSFIYLAVQQHYDSNMTAAMSIAARVADGPRFAGDIRAILKSVNPNLPIVSFVTLDDATALGLMPQRVVASFSAALGTIGLLLAAIGIYGLAAFTVAWRTREIGIRIALGARQSDVMTMVMRQGLVLAVIGGAIGLAFAAGASQILVVFFFGLPAIHPPTFIGAALLCVAVGVLACYVPARRATRLDPLEALRRE
jgi:predicted permease